MLVEANKALVQVLKKIPIFKDLSPPQVRQVLSICTPRFYQPQNTICKGGASSEDIYILLSGKLEVATAEGIEVADITPVTTVGEMGVITGQPRSATVTAAQPSHFLVLPKSRFDYLLREDVDMRARVYKNVVDILAHKLINSNVRMRDFQTEKGRYEGRIGVLERQFAELSRKMEVALDMLAEQGEMTRTEAEEYLADRAQEPASLGASPG